MRVCKPDGLKGGKLGWHRKERIFPELALLNSSDLQEQGFIPIQYDVEAWLRTVWKNLEVASEVFINVLGMVQDLRC